MAMKTEHFEAIGVPLTPIDDSNNWDPYQVAAITVKDASGKAVAQTRTMAPIFDEINCAKCHGTDAFNDILQKHDKLSGTNLQSQKPVLCSSCHSSPHAMVPSSQTADNYQTLQYQGKAVPIGDCGVCHRTSKGDNNLGEYLQTHGGTNPERANMCYICHTVVSTNDTTKWPHQFQ
jgi:hypothetical protein